MDDQFINDLVRIARLVLRPYVGLDRPARLAGMAGQAPLEDEHYLLAQVAQALPDRSVFFESTRREGEFINVRWRDLQVFATLEREVARLVSQRMWLRRSRSRTDIQWHIDSTPNAGPPQGPS